MGFRTGVRLPSGPLKMDNVKTAGMPYLCGVPLFFCFYENINFYRFRPLKTVLDPKKWGTKIGIKVCRNAD